MVEKKEAYISIPSSPRQSKYGPFSSKESSLYTESSSVNGIGGLRGARSFRALRRIFLWITCTVLGLHFLSKQYRQVPRDSVTCSATYKDSLEYPTSFPWTSRQMWLDASIRRLARAYGKEFFGQCYRPGREDDDIIRALKVATAEPFSRPSASSAFFSNFPTQIAESQDVEYPVNYASASQIYSAAPTAVDASNTSFRYAEPAQITDYVAEVPEIPKWLKTERSARMKYTSARWADPLPGVPTPLQINDQNTVVSFSAYEYTDLYIASGDGIEVTVDILHASQAPQAIIGNNNTATVYLLPHDSLDYEDGISEYVKIVENRVELQTAGIKIKRRSSDDDTKVKCRLQVVLPPALEVINQDEPKPTLKTYTVLIKEGQVRASGITAYYFSARVGRGSVEFSSMEVFGMSVAVLDGKIHLPGVKFTQYLAAGVVRGSSTVLAKLQPSDLKYTLINMCADGYTYTNIMTPGDNVNGLAANFYIYRETGGEPFQNSFHEPLIKIPGDVYYTYEDLVYLDEHSTDVNKTGYLVSKSEDNYGSIILVYSGAKTAESRAIKSRFMYGFYDESPR